MRSRMFEGKKCAIKVLKTTDAENEVEEFKKEFQVLVYATGILSFKEIPHVLLILAYKVQ